MNVLETVNQKLNSNYKTWEEMYNSRDALEVCLSDEGLNKYIRDFKDSAWDYDNQELFSKIISNYKGSFTIKKVTNPNLLTAMYKCNFSSNFFYNTTEEALNEENIKLAFETGKYGDIIRNSPLALKVFLQNDYDIDSNMLQFTAGAWNEENANTYLDLLEKGVDKKIHSYQFYCSNICLKETIKRHQFSIMNKFNRDSIGDDVEGLGNLLYTSIKEKPEALEKLSVTLSNLKKYYLKAILETKRYDLIDDYYKESDWTSENIELYFNYLKNNHPDEILFSFQNLPNFENRMLEHNIFSYDIKVYKCDFDLFHRKLREFPNEKFNIDWSIDYIRNHMKNKDFVKTLIETKRFEAFQKSFGFIPYDEEIADMFAEVLEEYFNSGFDNIPYSFLSESKSINRRLIELGYLSRVNNLKDLGNATLFINKCIQDDRLNMVRHTYSRIFDYALSPVFDSGKFGSLFFSPDHGDDPFFKYLYEKRKPNIESLLDYYKIEEKNIDEYVRDGYITDKFRRVLLFDRDYQEYCLESGIDITEGIDDPILLAYLRCAYKVPNLCSGIFINETNYRDYFDEKGPKKELVDFLYNPISIKALASLVDAYPDLEIDPFRKAVAKKLSIIENSRVLSLCFKNIEEHNVTDESKVDDLIKIVFRVEYSNAIEISEFEEQIVGAVLETENPFETLDKIESVFLKENVPYFSKIYLCFQYLYPKFEKKNSDGNDIFDFREDSRISPDLLYASPNSVRMKLYKRRFNDDKKVRFKLVFNDLLRLAINSDNKSLRKYLDTLRDGNDCLLKLVNSDFNIKVLNEEEVKKLNYFVDDLTVVYEMVTNESLNNKDLVDKCKTLLVYFKPTERYSLADRVVRSIAYYANIDSLDQIYEMIEDKKKKCAKENEELGLKLERSKFELKDGDLLRCIGNFSILGSSLENGNVCKELLGSLIGKSDSDTTPLDVDLTLVEAKENMYASIDGTPTGWGFGNLFVVLKDDYTVTRDKDGNILESEYDPMKMEVFGTKTKRGGKSLVHWGGRSGFDRTNIKCFIYKKDLVISSEKPYNSDGSVNYESGTCYDDLPSIKFEIARNGLYIPIVDLSGNLIFTVEEYKEIRKKMMGLSYYGCDKYELNKDDLYFEGIDELVKNISDDAVRVANVREAICNRIKEILMDPQYDLGIDKILSNYEGDLRDGICELFETGSTSRFSCVPGDSDFDFILKIDKRLMIDPGKIKSMINMFLKELNPEETIPTKFNRFRGTGITIGDYKDLDIDISLDQRRNDSVYSSEVCLNDRYESIKKQYPDCYELVLANIIKAKQLLKEASKEEPGIYKSQVGGLGGIGVENWILQNGGSLKRAAEDFVRHAYDEKGNLIDFNIFKTKYFVFDFGRNHEPREKDKGIYYPYDNYIADNMNSNTYKKMAEVLKKYLEKIKENKNNMDDVMSR